MTTGFGWSIPSPIRTDARSRMREVRNIVILTGAGISAESGLATFRGPDGLWEGHRVEGLSQVYPRVRRL